MKTEESRVERSGLIESRANNRDAPCRERHTIVMVGTLKRRCVSRTATSRRVKARGVHDASPKTILYATLPRPALGQLRAFAVSDS